MRETVDLRNYLSLLWRRKWMVIIPTLVAGLAGFVITMPRIMKPVYRCSATLLVEQPAGLTQDVAGLVSNVSLQERLARLDSQIQSNEFLTKIIANTGMRAAPRLAIASARRPAPHRRTRRRIAFIS